MILAFLAIAASDASASPNKSPSNKSCKSCHRKEWKEWRASQHFGAGKNAVFLYEYNAHPGKWCLKCHAPRSKANANLRPLAKRPAMRQGVDCITCHFKEGQLTSRAKADKSPHDTHVDKDFGAPAMCAGCHQFNFPKLDSKGSLIHYTSQPMQNTYAEFQKSPAAARGAECISCHMPTGRGHRFPGAYDSKMVSSALGISLCREESALRLTIRNKLQAHNLPSGGVNRSIVIDVSAAKGSRRPRRYRLERLFDGPIGKRVKTKDTTLTPGQWKTWSVPYSLLSLNTPDDFVVESKFFFGTDPNHNFPTTQYRIDRTETSRNAIPTCPP